MNETLKRCLIFLGILVVGIVVYIYRSPHKTPRERMAALAGAKPLIPRPICLSLLLFTLTAGVTLTPAALAQAPSAKSGTPLVEAPTETKKWTGDLDALLKRRVIRVGRPLFQDSLLHSQGGTVGCGLRRRPSL